jgi:cysteine-S-conjugate beta-lyase
MKIATALTALGRSSEIAPGTVNLPVVRASTVTFDSLAHMDEVQAAFAADDPNNLQPTYGITNLPLKVALEQLSCEIEGGPLASQLRAQAYGSGLAAVAAGLMSQVKAGDHVLITDSVYGPTRRLADETQHLSGVCREPRLPHV